MTLNKILQWKKGVSMRKKYLSPQNTLKGEMKKKKLRKTYSFYGNLMIHTKIRVILR